MSQRSEYGGGRDFWYHELMNLPLTKNSGKCETEVMDSEDPLFILYTSGTTGKPKAVLHTHGGYQLGVYATLKDVFDLKEEDRGGVPRRSRMDYRTFVHHLRDR